MAAWVRRLLLVLGAVLAGLGLVAGYANRELLDGPTFAAHVDEIRRDDDVAARLGERITDQVLARNPDLVAIQPLVQSLAASVAGGDLLSGPTTRAAATAHAALVAGETDLVVLNLAGAASIVVAAVQHAAPDTAPFPPDAAVTLATIGSGAASTTLVQVATTVGVLAWLLPLLALACFALAIWRSPSRWETSAGCGWALVWAAAGVGFALVGGGFVVRRADPDTLGGAVARAAWAELVRPLWWGVAGLAVIGALVVVACLSSAPAALARTTARLRAVVLDRPRRPMWVIVRALVAAGIAVVAIADPASLVEPLIVLGGVALLLFAVIEVGGLATASRRATAAPGTGSTERRRVATVIAAAVVGVLLVVGGVVLLARPGRDVEAELVTAGAGDVCNGHAELCDRPFDEVAYVASHNAMSVAGAPGWFIGEQADPIPVQLDQGVRALLVDVWSGIPAGSVVRTAPGSYDEAKAQATAELGPEVVDAALRLADSIAGPADGPEARYLCHGLCEIGSTPFDTMLASLRTWLVMNPDEVVTLFIEDHVPADLLAADIEAAGLVPFTYVARAGEPFPTLGEMIRAGTRLVVMLEEGSGGDAAPWLVNGFELTQDTPYTFPTVESFSCAPNRGPADAPLFLVNHWLSGFGSLVSNAEAVNRRDVLLPRLEQCQTERGQIPNFVGVNFVDLGDVWDAVESLNGF